MADRIAVIDHGRVIAEGTPGQLKAQVGSGALKVRVAEPADREQAAQILSTTLGDDVIREKDAAALTVRLSQGTAASSALVALEEAGLNIETFALGQPSLDEVFLALTGKITENHDDDAAASAQTAEAEVRPCPPAPAPTPHPAAPLKPSASPACCSRQSSGLLQPGRSRDR